MQSNQCHPNNKCYHRIQCIIMHDTFFMLVYIVLGSLIYPIQSANAKEVWMEMDVQDGGVTRQI